MAAVLGGRLTVTIGLCSILPARRAGSQIICIAAAGTVVQRFFSRTRRCPVHFNELMATVRRADAAVGTFAFGWGSLITRGGADAIKGHSRAVGVAFVQSLRGGYCVVFRLQFPPAVYLSFDAALFAVRIDA